MARREQRLMDHSRLERPDNESEVGSELFAIFRCACACRQFLPLQFYADGGNLRARDHHLLLPTRVSIAHHQDRVDSSAQSERAGGDAAVRSVNVNPRSAHGAFDCQLSDIRTDHWQIGDDARRQPQG